MANLTRYLWISSRNAIALTFPDPPEKVVLRLSLALAACDEFMGKVVNHGFKIWRSRRYAQSRNTFAPILYGIVRADGEGSRVDGHFQINPVMRLFLIVWFVGTTVLAVLFLTGGMLRATPESTALEAIPYMIPALLPMFGWGLLLWQQRRGRADEEAIRRWVEETCAGRDKDYRMNNEQRGATP
jgi:hypothetical protein